MKIKELIAEYKKNRKAPKFNVKPRTGHAPTQTGAGAHKDSKRSEKQGNVKHKKDLIPTEGWSDAMVARRTGQPRTPYSVYIKGKKWKDFANDDHARAVMDKLKAKFKADGRNPETITIAPTDIPESNMHEAYGRPDFEVNGWKYITDVEEEEDNRKIYHTALDPNGKRYDINFTPYERMTAKTFQLWIKLGAPSRLGDFGSFDNEDIVKAAEIHGIANLDPMMANAGKKEGFVDASNMSRRDVQRLGHEDDDTPEQYGVFINGNLWKKFATRDEANRVSLAIERKHGKSTTVRSI
jgi:hypothetical protein